MLNHLNARLEAMDPQSLHRLQVVVRSVITAFLLFLIFFAVPTLVSAIFGPDWLS